MPFMRDERGQATAEYALVIVAAAVIATALIVWASSSGVLPEFFDAVLVQLAIDFDGPVGRPRVDDCGSLPGDEPGGLETRPAHQAGVECDRVTHPR